MFTIQRFPTDRAYFIAKELLTTERTYLKDLEVVTVVRWAYISMPLCCLVSPICLSAWGEALSLFWFSSFVATRPPNHIDGQWHTNTLAEAISFFIHSPLPSSEMYLSMSHEVVNTKPCLCLKRRLDLAVRSLCVLIYSILSDFIGWMQACTPSFAWYRLKVNLADKQDIKRVYCFFNCNWGRSFVAWFITWGKW